MFESGNWKMDVDDEEADEEDDAQDDAWNLEKLRQETEAIRERKEAERIAAQNGQPVPPPVVNGDTVDTGDGAASS
jgi:hypothetical protein